MVLISTRRTFSREPQGRGYGASQVDRNSQNRQAKTIRAYVSYYLRIEVQTTAHRVQLLLLLLLPRSVCMTLVGKSEKREERNHCPLRDLPLALVAPLHSTCKLELKLLHPSSALYLVDREALPNFPGSLLAQRALRFETLKKLKHSGKEVHNKSAIDNTNFLRTKHHLRGHQYGISERCTNTTRKALFIRGHVGLHFQAIG